MNFFQFVIAFLEIGVDLIRAVAWPVVVAAGIWILRGPLSTLLPTLKSLKLPGAEAVFKESLEEFNKAADDANIPEASALSTTEHNELSDDLVFKMYTERETDTPELPDLTPSGIRKYLEHGAQNASPTIAIFMARALVETDLEFLLKRENLEENLEKLALPTNLKTRIARAKGYLTWETVKLIEKFEKSFDAAIFHLGDVTMDDARHFGELTIRTMYAIRRDFSRINPDSLEHWESI